MIERRKSERRVSDAVRLYGDRWTVRGADRRVADGESRESQVMAQWTGFAPATRNRLTLALARRHDDDRRAC